AALRTARDPRRASRTLQRPSSRAIQGQWPAPRSSCPAPCPWGGGLPWQTDEASPEPRAPLRTAAFRNRRGKRPASSVRFSVPARSSPLDSDLALDLLPVLLAQVLLEHLAGKAAGQRCDEVHRLRRHHAAQALLAKRDQFVGPAGRAGVQLDDRLDGLTPLLVGHADHGAVLHRGVRPQNLLDLARV